MEPVVVIVFVLGLLLMWVGNRARAQDDEPTPSEPPPVQPPPAEKFSVPRHYVHRSTMILELDSLVPGTALVREQHEQWLVDTELDVLVACEDPSETSGAIQLVTDAMSPEGMEPRFFQQTMLTNADRELAQLPFVWVERRPGLHACESSDGRAAARLLRVELFEQLPFPRERAVVMVPNLDTVLVADRQNEAALLELLTLAEARYADPHWFTLTAFCWNGEGWSPAHATRTAEQSPLSDAVTAKLLALVGRGVLQDFRDATAQPLFPPARTVRLSNVINATWLEGTSVIVPTMASHRMLALQSRDGETTAMLKGRLAAAFVECVERDGHSSLPVLDEGVFPPREVLELLALHGEAEPQELAWSSGEALRAMKKDSALLFVSEPPLVLFADGRTAWLADDELDFEALFEAISSAPLKAWVERVVKHRALRLLEKTVTATALTLAAHGDVRERLTALDELHTETPLRGTAMAAAVELALKSEDSDLIRVWVRRGVKEQPLNQMWHLTLSALQFSAAKKADDAGKKPFDAASWTSSQGTQFDEAGPRAALMPVLRPPGHTKRAQAQMRELARQNAGSPENLLIQDPQRWPFARGLEVELVYDFGKKMRPLTSMDATGGLAAELKEVALFNLQFASGGVLPVRDGAWFPDWTDGFAASRLLMPWEELDWSADDSRTGDVIAFTPVYDSFLVAPASDARALEAVLREAEQMVERADAPWRTLLTGLPWRYDATKQSWVEHELPASHPLAGRIAALEAKVIQLRAT